MLLWRELEGMQAKTPLWLASTRAISSELTVVSSASVDSAAGSAAAAAARENTMRTLGDAATGANEGVSTGDDEGVTSTS